MAHLLSDQKVKGTFRIKNIKGSETTRLMEMGIIPGMNLEIVRRAPLGYPVEIKVNGILLTLREQEATCIEIEG